MSEQCPLGERPRPVGLVGVKSPPVVPDNHAYYIIVSGNYSYQVGEYD